jgi:DNA-directed RNA polymerase specialized sigma24 family protein
MSSDEEIIRLLAVIVRQNSATQTDAIVELGRSGFGPTRASELLGTSVATAKVALQRARRKRARKPARAPGDSED